MGQSLQKPIIFDHYGLSQGFNASQVLCLEKTKDGFLWIGTEQGLFRYDGHDFKSFRSNPSDSTTISSNYIKRMVEDKHGRLWMSALPDLNIFDTKTGKCLRVQIPAEIDDENKLNITNIKYDEKNDVMWLTTNKGLLFSQGKEVRLRQEFIPEKDVASGIYALEIDDNGIFWLAANDGLWRYDADNCTAKNFHRPNHNPNVKYDDGFFSSYYDRKNKIIWVGSRVSGLMKFDISTETISDYTFADKTKIQNGVLTIQKSGLKGEEHILWLGTTDGVKSFDMITNSFYDFKTQDHNDIKGIPGAGFCFVPTDSEGMWIGTYRGLHRYDPFKQNIETIEVVLPNSQTNWILGELSFESGSKSDSIVWFGVEYGSFFRYNIIKGQLASIPAILHTYCQKVNPYTSYIDSKNILWLSSEMKGFVGYDLSENKLVKPIFKTGSQNTPKILKIEEDKAGNLWLGSTSGMYIYHRQSNEVREQEDIRKFLDQKKLSDFTFRFTIDTKGKVWIFSTKKYKEDDALYVFDSSQKEIKLFTQDKYPALKILKSLEAIKSISHDNLIITSFNGFCIVNTSTDEPTFELYETYNEKPLGSFRSITKDHNGNVWMSSDNGIVRFDTHTKTVSKFTYFDSNIGTTPMPEIAFSHRSNCVYISQNMAFNRINVANLDMANPSEIVLSDMKILDYNVGVLPHSGETLNLRHDQNSIDLQFSNLSFTNSQNNSYQYMLNTTKREWSSMTDNHLKFDNLGYGTYSLRVRAENSFGLKSINEFVLNIIISPPFWRTWWFNGLIIFLISFIIYSFFKYRDIQRKKLDKLRHTIARDLHDDMGSTLSHIKMMSEREAMRKDSNQSFQTIADKTAEVMNNMTEIIWSINPKNDSLKNILEKILEFAIDTLEPMGVIINIDIDEVPSNIKLNPEERRHFYLIFKEAINNTSKYSKASEVNFCFKMENNKMITTFFDNGLGFDPMIIKRGNGLKNMESRGKALGGIVEIMTDSNGTKISLSI